MVLTIRVDPSLITAMTQEIAPLLSLLEPYSEIHAEPRVLLLRNPDISPDQYHVWQKDHRFGRFTCPTSHHPTWLPGGAIAEAASLARTPHLDCVSAMLILFSKPNEYVSYHKDPCAYERIASFTLEGDGIMNVRHGNAKGVPYDLHPSVGIVLEENDCLQAKHSVQSSSRLGLVLRYTDVTWRTRTA